MNWNNLLKAEQQQDYFQTMLKSIADERAQGINIFPCDDEIFTAFSLTPFEQVKVVILGQDPYHGDGQAHGLSFSVKPGIKVPPSLANMYKELATDIDDFKLPNHGCLTPWAKQGVLLLNTVLTVRKANAHSHSKLGWERYTDKVIELLNEHSSGLVFMLWGSHAQKKGKFIDTDKHCVLTSVHPSPLSAYRGFLGCKHFSKANDYLIKHKKNAIHWPLDNIENTDQISLL
ncbi:uracil-DNA glycosylase [Thalassotalea psychrophila]|uniref:Uracil-DNA glycosylase n=1 Tax=Thalassotalea psychrophila TaxID=3065647 RepID=A0ABY9TXD5_9GAMM|nr:uracil-DNA glycosylase [Colwelliaceae bacterium SQ149]